MSTQPALKALGNSKDSGPPGIWTLEALYLASIHHIHLQLSSQTALTLSVNICLHSSLCHKGEWEERGRATDFLNGVLDLFLMYLATPSLPLGSSEKLNCVAIIRKGSLLSTDVFASETTPRETTPQKCFLYWKLFSSKSWKIPRKLSTTQSDFSNVVGATLHKLLYLMDTFLRIHKEFKNLS